MKLALCAIVALAMTSKAEAKARGGFKINKRQTNSEPMLDRHKEVSNGEKAQQHVMM